ncbi:MAG: glycoside hydrolase family 36 protein, partial [bacterium]
EETILQDLRGCAAVLDKGDLFQVDDGWEPAVGDWLAPDAGKFPGGMKAVAEAIHREGFEAGLWLAPFVAERDSALWREHPDWFLLVEGKPWSCGSNWSGFYSLDIDNPEVEAYLREVFRRVFHVWGFDFVKLDFLYGAAPFGNERETRAGRMLRAMRLLREICGCHPILGCGVPIMPAFGLVEYCRVSCDVSLSWDDKPQMRLAHRERVSTRQALETSTFRRQLSGRAWLSDPDVFFLREENVELTEGQKDTLATANRLLGGVFLCSDDMSRYDAAKKEKYRALCALRPVGKVTACAEEGLRLRCRTAEGPKVVDLYAK